MHPFVWMFTSKEDILRHNAVLGIYSPGPRPPDPEVTSFTVLVVFHAY